MDANDVEKPQGQKKSAKHNSGAADLEKVTDFAEEREVLPQDITNVSTVQTKYILLDLQFSCSMFQAFNLIDNRRSKEAAEKLARERELAKVTIKKEDVETLVISSKYACDQLLNLKLLNCRSKKRKFHDRKLREYCGKTMAIWFKPWFRW